jgi:hypothetical protein
MANFNLRNIDSTFQCYEQIIKLYNECKNILFEDINISLEQWFGANLSSALGGVLDKIEANFNKIKIENVPDSIKTIIQKNDFLSHYGFPRLPDNYGTIIKYLKLKPADGRFFYNYVVKELLYRPELPAMSLPLKKKITESIYEIFVNAQYHSETEFIYTCGQFYPSQHKIEFTITDTGIGFKNKVNRRFNRNLTSIQAIKWATTEGHSTKVGISGGIGLALLKEFVKKNNGKIQIVSDDGFYQLDANGEQKKLFSYPFPGSIVNVQFRTDDIASYALMNEPRTEDLF